MLHALNTTQLHDCMCSKYIMSVFHNCRALLSAPMASTRQAIMAER